MPLPDFADPAILAFMAENFEKEKRLRSLWIRKHFGALETAASFQHPPLNRQAKDATIANIKGGIATLARDHSDSYRHRVKVSKNDAPRGENFVIPKHGHSIVDVGLGDSKEDPRLARPDTDLSFDPIMRPVDPKTTEMLRKDKPEFGRVRYLIKRSEIEPEKRYYFAECFSWDYGWRINDAKAVEKPKHGRFWTLKRSLSNRAGPSPDPKYYKDPNDIHNVTKCFR